MWYKSTAYEIIVDDRCVKHTWLNGFDVLRENMKCPPTMFFHRWTGITGKICAESYTKGAFCTDFPRFALNLR